MALPQEVAQELYQVIQGGAEVGTPAEIIQFPSDNGSNIWSVIKQTFKGNNGTAFNYYVYAWETVKQGVPVALSGGAAMLTMEVGTLGAFVAPALGLTTGYALYGLAPEFWDTVGGALEQAGETIGGKVVTFLDENGIIHLPQDTIEIIKNALVNAGIYDNAGIMGSGSPNVNVNINYPVNYHVGNIGEEGEGNTYIIGLSTQRLALIAYDGVYALITCASYTWNTGELHYSDGGFDGLSASGTKTIDGKVVFYRLTRIAGEYFSILVGLGIPFITGTGITEQDLADVAWVLNYGYNPNEGKLQDGAKYPSSGEQFPLTYPEWMPKEFPDVDGQQLPEAYPLQYPDLLPQTQPYQDPAQNPDPDDERLPETYTPYVENPLNQPDYEPAPEPSPLPDPDTGDVPDPIPPTPEPSPTPDPIKPDPAPEPSVPTPTPIPPTTASSSKLFTVYNPSLANLNGLGAYLWDNSIVDAVKKLWQNPLDGIISLIQVFVTPQTGGSANIMLGYLDSGVSAPVVSNQFVTVDCGTVRLKEKNKNATDYTPYTSLSIYLPFIGITELDANEFMNGTINVSYTVDVYTGTCLAQVKCTRSGDMPRGAILYTFSGNCSQQLPLTSGDATGVLRALINSAGAGLSIATGGGLGVVAGALSIANNLSHDMLHVGHSGNLSANAGIMGIKKPYLIISRQRPYTANKYNEFSGYPANKTVYMNNCHGFTRFKSVLLKTVATNPERVEIENLLKEGVLF